MLKLDKLVKTYKTGDQALKAVDIEIPKGQVLALIGPSGAGKSTLIDRAFNSYGECFIWEIRVCWFLAKFFT